MTTAVKMVKNVRYEGERLFGMRHMQCLLCFFCLSLAYALRVNLSVGLVAMTDVELSDEAASHAYSNTGINATTIPTTTTTDAITAAPASSNKIMDYNIYDWSEQHKAFVLSAFFWGYILVQIPGGLIAERYGAKMLLLIGVSLCSILTILTPVAVQVGGWQMLIAVRVFEGITQGSVHPATHAMLAQWAPVHERGILGTICYSGSQFGTIIMLATSGFIADSPLGWPFIFYLPGLCGFIWAIVWYIFAASSPKTSKRITPDELKFIETSLGHNESTPQNVAPTPWKSIFTSPPFISLIIVHCTHMFGFWMLLTQIPNYMKNIYDIDIKGSALLSSLPYTLMLVLSFFFVWLSFYLSKKNLSLTFSRKFFNSIGHWIPMCSLIALGYVPRDNATLAVVLLTVTVGISAATYLGFQVNHIDLSPNYAGTLMGITNGAANVMSALAPLTVGLIVTNAKSVGQWQIMFFVAAALYFIGNLLFVLLGKTDVQHWNTPDAPRTSPDDDMATEPLNKQGNRIV